MLSPATRSAITTLSLLFPGAAALLGCERCSREPAAEAADAAPVGPAAARTLGELGRATEIALHGDVVCTSGKDSVSCLDASAPPEGYLFRTEAGPRRAFSIHIAGAKLRGGLDALALRDPNGTAWWWRTTLEAPIREARASGPDVVEFAGSDRAGCLLRADGMVRCWGLRSRTDENRLDDTAREMPGLPPSTQIATGSSGSLFACSVTRAKQVYCWGDNYDAHLPLTHAEQDALCRNGKAYPIGTTMDASAAGCPTGRPLDFDPVLVPLVSSAKHVSCGEHHCCAMSDEGRVWCWGRNSDGEVGRATWERPETVVQLDAGDGVTEISTGRRSTCARFRDGAVRCWGLISDGTSRQRAFGGGGFWWFRVLGMPPVERLALGERIGCGVTAEGVRCWGSGGSVAP